MLLHGGDGWGISPERDEALWRGLIAAQKAARRFFFKGGRCGFMSQNEEFIFGTELVFVHFLIFNR